MPLFQYQPEDGPHHQGYRPRQQQQMAAASSSRPVAHAPSQPSRTTTVGRQREPSWGIGGNDDNALDYDIQAALEIEEAEAKASQYHAAKEDDFYYHHEPARVEPVASTSRPANAFNAANNARAFRENGPANVRSSHQERPAQPPAIPSSSKGKTRAIELDGHDDEDSDVDMIPVVIKGHNANSGASNSTAEIEQLTKEIDSIDEQIASLKAARALLVEDRAQLFKQQASAKDVLRKQQQQQQAKQAANNKNGDKSRPTNGIINYSESKQFNWKKKLDGILDRVFGIKQLRLCQEGVLNAVLDGRDVICIMPTGGGKSVCFQAPALMTHGVTLVISPLLSLMADQVVALNQKGVEAVMITGSSTQAEIKDITQRLISPDGNIKLCYVTPEKLARSKTFLNTLGKMYAAGLLARIAIDESHCCSQMGHDFRPDYKKLSMLKQLYPNTPIIALTATCGKTVLNDVVKILHLKACTAGDSAEPYKTVFFSAPLYRPNLHYSVRIKSAQAQGLAIDMADEIMTRYPDSAGIIYCLSQKETETFALAISEQTEGKVKIGTYHAGMEDYDKERIHMKWRKGEIKCVVATIAFGMGIDAPDGMEVNKKLYKAITDDLQSCSPLCIPSDYHYQETGRAGRDGKPSDCILWFRSADASRLSTLTLSEADGSKKLHNMLKYALDYKTCRKLLFDSYFGNPANVVAPFAESDRTDCGHCDNCLRKLFDEQEDKDEAVSSLSKHRGLPEGASTAITEYIGKQSVTTRDASLEAWKVCKIIRAADNVGSRITLPGAADLCRGLAKASFPTKDKNQKATLDLDFVCGGKITTINKDDMEILLLELLMKGFLKEEYVQTAYTINSYIVSGPQSIRLSRLRSEQVPTSGISIELTTVGARAKKSKAKGKDKEGSSPDEETDHQNEDDSDTQVEVKDKPIKKQARKRKSSLEDKSADDSKASGRKGKSKAKGKGKERGKGEAANHTATTDTSSKRRRKATSDSEDWEDLGFGSSTALSKTAGRPSGSTCHTTRGNLDPQATLEEGNMDISDSSSNENIHVPRKESTRMRQHNVSNTRRPNIIDLDSDSND